MNRAVRAAWPALTIAVALVASIVATTTVSGGSSALLVVRGAVLVLLSLSVAAVLGVLVTVLSLPPRETGRRGRLLDVAAGASALWAVAAGVTAFLLYLGEAPPMSSASFGPGLVSFVTDIEVGRTWLIAAVAAAVLSALLVAVRSRAGLVGVLVTAAVVAAPVALRSATPGEPLGVARTVVAAGFVQLLALGTWLGVLAVGAGLSAPVRRGVPVGCFGVLALALGTSWPVLASQGLGVPVALIGGGAVALAGLLATVARVAVRAPSFRAVQLLLLGVGSGLGAAASITQTVPDVAARTTPAELLTGAPLPPSPTIGALVGAWQPDALWIVVCGSLLVGYGLVALRTRGRPAIRSVVWIVGVLVLAWLTNGAPAVYSHVLLEAHLLQHVGLLLVVPLLLAGGAPVRLLPADEIRRAALVLARPVPAAVVTVAAVVVLYGSPVLRWSVSDALGTEVVSGACLLVGVLLVNALTAPTVRRRTAVVVAAVLLVIETGGAVLLALSPSLLLVDWFGAMGWGTDALAAQRAGADRTWLIAALPTALLLVRALRIRGTPTPLARLEAAAA